MAKIKRKYIDSHWLVFAVEGAVALLCGWYIMFSANQDLIGLTFIVGSMLLGLGLIELFNVLHREKMQQTWGFSLAVAAFEIIAALLLLFTLQQNAAWHLGILAGYTIVRGIFELLIAVKSVDDSTDKFIWLLCGICGIIVGFVVFNSGHFATGTFMKFFASYLMILGVADLIYGIHNRDQKNEDRLARKSAARKTSQKRK